MSRYKLRRCDLCKNYHVSYVVADPITGEKTYLCSACWKARYAAKTFETPGQEASQPDEQAKDGWLPGKAP